MKISERWLREFCDPKLTTDELCEQLTLLGLEIESVTPAAPAFAGVVVAAVEAVEPHPNADKLRVCRVSDGRSVLQIVCGAPNVAAGMRVPLATLGAALPDGLQIKPAKLRGVDSQGMLCSAKELGLSDKSEGLLALRADAPVGTDIRDYLQLDDQIIELKVTPNRGDCLSILGVARELSARNRLPLADQAREAAVAAKSNLQRAVSIEASEACIRYAGRIVSGIRPEAQTPFWMVERLRRAGIRSLHPAVDVTNYVMLELGQPMHAFDLRKLAGNEIRVRWAKAGEKLQAISGDVLTLDAQSLVIADADGPVALAGVMGGVPTAVDANTTSVFLESACFVPKAMAGTARRYKLHTDSSHRFERGVDPALALRALARATELLIYIGGGEAGPITQQGSADAERRSAVGLRLSRVIAVLGYAVTATEVTEVLQGLGMSTVLAGADAWKVTPPSYRYDITIEADLIEEIARVLGYERLPDVPATAVLPKARRTETQIPASRLSDLLIARGYHEAVTYSFVDPALESLLGDGKQSIPLDNPIAANLARMRTTVLAGLIPALIYNQQRQQGRVRLFEQGPVFRLDGSGTIKEAQRIAGVVTGEVLPLQWGSPARLADFYDLKADVEALLALGGRAGHYQIAAGGPAWLHPGQSATVRRSGAEVGWFGCLHPQLSAKLDLRHAPLVFELGTAALCEAQIPRSQTVSEYPAMRRDLAVVLGEKVIYAEIFDKIQSLKVNILSELKVFDIYRGKGLPSGYKSVALALNFQDKSRTLEDQEVDSAMTQIRAALQQGLGAQFRE